LRQSKRRWRRKGIQLRGSLAGLGLAAAIVGVAAILVSGACGDSEGSEGDAVTGTMSATATRTPRTASPTLTDSPPEPTPTPTFPTEGALYTVVAGDTLFDIAQRFGVTVEAIVAVNHIQDPTAISVGQVLIIPGDDVVIPPGTPTVQPTAAPVDPRLTGFAMPIAGACLPSSGNLMPNAPREYRSGIHEGVDFYSGYNCVDVPAGAPVLAAKAGTVVRADTGFVEMTLEELNAILARTQAQGYTDAEALDKFRGRQVWVDHGSGVVTRYCHLSGIPGGIVAGTQVSAGQLIGLVGDSGTPEAVTNPGVEIHLHWEMRVGNSYLGAGLPADQVRALYQQLFAGP
jgi:murein DD-endopeptidase MepM/ murein hydrolase activator NlpD